MGNPDPREHVSELRREAVDLLRAFRRGFENYKANRTLGPMIAGEIAFNVLNLPKTKVERAVRAFQKDWETTPEYAQLESSLGELRRETTEFLRSVAEKTPRGYRRDLTGKLRPLSQVARLETKISKLVGVLETLEGSELLYLDRRETFALLREYGVSGTDSELEEWLRSRGFEVDRRGLVQLR